MKNKVEKIIYRCKLNEITVDDAAQQILNLFVISDSFIKNIPPPPPDRILKEGSEPPEPPKPENYD